MNERLSDLLASYLRARKAEDLSPRTIYLDEASVRMFCAWLAEDERPEILEEMTRGALTAWLAGLTDLHEPATVAIRFRALRGFCRWLEAEGIVTVSPMQGLKQPSVRTKPVPVIKDEHLSALLKTCSSRSFADRRDEAIIRLLLDCGLRVSELTSLTAGDIDLDDDSAEVLGKGRKPRRVYLSSKTVRALDRYIRARRESKHRSTPELFLGNRGKLTPDGVRQMLNRRADAAGLPHLHPHMFRHTVAHDHLMSGGQERDLKRLMGWSSDLMLERYGASAADVRAREAHKRMRRGDRV